MYNWLTREQGGELIAGKANRGAVGLRFAELLGVILLRMNVGRVEGGHGDVGGDEVVGEAGDG